MPTRGGSSSEERGSRVDGQQSEDQPLWDPERFLEPCPQRVKLTIEGRERKVLVRPEPQAARNGDARGAFGHHGVEEGQAEGDGAAAQQSAAGEVLLGDEMCHVLFPLRLDS